MVDGLAVFYAFGPGGVVGYHTSYGCPAGGSRIRCKVEAKGFGSLVELVPYHSGLHGGGSGFRVQPDDVVKMFGKVDDQGVVYGLAGQACSTATRLDGYAVLVRQLNQSDEFLFRLRYCNSYWLHLVKRGIGSIESQCEVIIAYARHLFGGCQE